MMVPCHIFKGDKKQVADELADVVSVPRLSGNDLCDLEDLWVGDLLDLLS